ncbi:transcriptional regulatory protein [Thermacetogenium phaeum DSM 12270]|uniref:Stage 0 sporulation protein A homolog n=1 Tax=Thermacetogenium phaeum (strain ATCC BAA-254 / DSM 26808 / PB) TaxID=1089553 RepID=K4LS55_THEPS|nr:response regulator [Thermacetogenium phaeum]AFV10924.1 transcriptional regulatory protein [Thermacetogenium phaeum DSM 12270]
MEKSARKSRLKVLIADDEPITRMDIKEILQENGYNVVIEAGDGLAAVKLAEIYCPDIVLMDIRMPHLNGIEAAAEISQKIEGAIIFLTAYSDITLIEEAKQIPKVVGYIVKPVSEEEILPAVEIGFSCFLRMQTLEKEKEKFKGDLEARKIIERAKGILMQKYGWSEEFAYKKLRRLSMDQRKPMKEIAEAIIFTDFL